MTYITIIPIALFLLYIRGKYILNKMESINEHRRLLLLKFDYNQVRIDLYIQFSVESFNHFEIDRASLWNQKVSQLIDENEEILEELKILVP